jgi:ACR3 family arsenite transporter
VPWDTLLTSVVLYIVIPVILAQLLRKALLKNGTAAFETTMAKIGPWSITALLVTLVLLFAFQGEAILKQPLVIGLLAVPILIQVFFNSALAYWLNRAVGEQHNIACPSALLAPPTFSSWLWPPPSACLVLTPAPHWPPLWAYSSRCL